MNRWLLLLFCLLCASCSKSPVSLYRVALETSQGPVIITVHREWAPIGADRFRQLVEQHYFDQARFFRVVPNFVVQFGLAADPKATAKWEGTELADDPVRETNARGTVSFATRGPHTRTTQLFINTANNARLDASGFAPFAVVTEGMEAVDRFNNRHGGKPDQGAIKRKAMRISRASFPISITSKRHASLPIDTLPN